MEDISNSEGLKKAILLSEEEQTIKWNLLKEQFHITFESLKPINILKNTFNEVTSSPGIIDNLFGTTIGLSSGYITKKIFTGTSGNIFRKLIGSFLQLAVTNIIARNPDTIKSIGGFIFQHIFSKKDKT